MRTVTGLGPVPAKRGDCLFSTQSLPLPEHHHALQRPAVTLTSTSRSFPYVVAVAREGPTSLSLALPHTGAVPPSPPATFPTSYPPNLPRFPTLLVARVTATHRAHITLFSLRFVLCTPPSVPAAPSPLPPNFFVRPPPIAARSSPPHVSWPPHSRCRDARGFP